MHHLSAAFLIITLVIVVNQGGVSANYLKLDQQTEESKNRAVTIVDGPKYVAQPNQHPPAGHSHEQRPPSTAPSKPPNIHPANQRIHVENPRHYYRHIQKVPPARHYNKPALKRHHSPNSIYKYPRVIPLPPHKNQYYVKSRPLVFAASTGQPTIAKSPKFSLPVQTINGIRTDFVRPPKHFITNTTTTSTTEAPTPTTAAPTTTTRVLRTKRIWPKRIIDKINSTSLNTTQTNENTTKANSTKYTDQDTSASVHRTRYVYINSPVRDPTTAGPVTTRSYRPVTRAPRVRSTTASAINLTKVESNDWVPIIPSHYPKLRRTVPTPISKRSDILTDVEAPNQRTMYLHSFGLIPVGSHSKPTMARKKMVFFKRKRQLNPYYSGYSPKPRAPYMYDDLEGEGSRHRPQVVKIKHHHHHHHHRYVKTVEKKVPFRVEVPKPYPVEKKVPVPVEKIKIVERRVPYQVTVEKNIPYPIGIKIPHPVPVKVVEKEYVPKPYPVIHHVPVVKHVPVKQPCPEPVQVEKKVPYPVEVKVPYPVDRPVPVSVEKRVPYPVPVKVLVPQPYPVETKVPYPVEVKVKEPYEVVKHVHVKVPVPQPYPVKVPHPVPVQVEKKVPYPVEVEKKVPVPVPVRVLVPQRVEVEKRVPVYIPKPYPVEKKVPVPVKVPYPVRVPVRVPYEVPVVIHHPYQVHGDGYLEGEYNGNPYGDLSSTIPVTGEPQHTVTVHGNTGFTGFQSRSDKSDDVTTTHSPPS